MAMVPHSFPEVSAVCEAGRQAVGIGFGSAQILALLPGISRSSVTMVAGLARGLFHEEAARFSFLLATPVILAAGVRQPCYLALR